MKPPVRRFVGFAATALLIVLWAVVLRPASLGGPTTYVVVRGTSMLPTYDTGDLVVVRAADSYGPGDIVAYRVPDGDVGEGRIVIHRIVGGDAAAYTVEGDNNDSVDPWTPREADILGKAWIAIPSAGRVLALLHQPATLGALAAALVVTLLLARPVRRLRDDRAPQLGRWGGWRIDSSAASAASSSRSEARRTTASASRVAGASSSAIRDPTASCAWRVRRTAVSRASSRSTASSASPI